MRLKKVILRNFRCFEQLEIKLHPRLTVIVAENGGGKTAILDGIAIGLTPVLKYLSTASQRLSGPGFLDTDFRVKSVENNDCTQTSDYVQVEVETISNMKWDNWRPAAEGKQPVEKIGQKALAAYGSRIIESLNTDHRDLLPVFAYYGARRGWLPIPKRLSGTNIDYSQPASSLLAALEPLNDFKEMLNWFDIEEANELRANKDCMPEDYEPFESLEAVRDALIKILGNTYKNPHLNRQHKFVVETQNDPGQLQVSQLSQGYQSMLALGMDFARRQALANSHLSHIKDLSELQPLLDCAKQWPEDGWPVLQSVVNMAPAIMLVDEIDLHLHPSWQQRVLGDLMRAFPCTQFIVTTHSPQVLTTLRKENIRVLDRDENEYWSAEPPAFSPLAHEPGDALAAIMNTHPRPKLDGVTEHIHAYEQLARAGKADSAKGKELKNSLDEAGFEFNEADMALFRYLSQKAEQAGNNSE